MQCRQKFGDLSGTPRWQRDQCSLLTCQANAASHIQRVQRCSMGIHSEIALAIPAVDEVQSIGCSASHTHLHAVSDSAEGCSQGALHRISAWQDHICARPRCCSALCLARRADALGRHSLKVASASAPAFTPSSESASACTVPTCWGTEYLGGM